VTTTQRKAKIEKVLSHRQTDLTVVVEDITDPHNVSAILRTCDAVGVFAVHLVYHDQEFPELSSKSSSSALKWVKSYHHSSIQQCYDFLRSEGFIIGATALHSSSCNLYDLDLRKKTAIVVGNEHSGVSSEAAQQADFTFRVPMMGMVQSLNVSVATAVTIYEALRQRMSAGDYTQTKMSPQIFKKVREEWLENAPFSSSPERKMKS